MTETWNFNVKGATLPIDELGVPENMALKELSTTAVNGETLTRYSATGEDSVVKPWVEETFGVKLVNSTKDEAKVYTGKVPLDEYLASVVLAINIDGYVSQKKSSELKAKGIEKLPTSQLAWKILRSKDPKPPTWDAAMVKAKAVIAWARSDEYKAVDDLSIKVKAAVKDDAMSDRVIGHAAWAVGAYDQFNHSIDDRVSQFVGERFEYVDDHYVTIVDIRHGTNDKGNEWWLIKSKDDQKNIICWFINYEPKSKAGDRIRILTGQVDSHTEYQGVKQTTLKDVMAESA